jgi:hypothetical protein
LPCLPCLPSWLPLWTWSQSHLAHFHQGYISKLYQESQQIIVEGLSLSFSGSSIKTTVAIILLILVILFVGYGLPCYLVDTHVLIYSVSMHWFATESELFMMLPHLLFHIRI